MNISELSIRRPVLATVLTIIILLFGLIGYTTLGVREYPSLDALMEQAERLPYANRTDDTFVIVASRSHLTPETEAYIHEMQQKHAHVETISKGSSLKLCLIAEGNADVYPRFAPTMEWDTAAGHAIIRASGKEVYQAGKTEPLQYNKTDLLNPWFIAE